MTRRIYFDNAATSPPDPRVVSAAEPFVTQCWGNPSSLHQEGREVRAAVDHARRQVADLIGAEPGEIVFTGGGTEADALALQGVVAASAERPCHIITSAIEHPAVLECCFTLQRQGVGLTLLPVNEDGLIDPTDLERSMRPETVLVSIMAANNVVGTLQPIAELARIARHNGVLFHTDAIQAAGKMPLNVRSQSIDLLSISAHKLHGLKGVGALYVRNGVSLRPVWHGGGQENGRRSGTENAHGIVAFGQAAEIARNEMAEEAARLVQIRDFMIDSIQATIDNAYLIGHR